MNAKFADRMLRFIFISAFVLGTVWMPAANARAQSTGTLELAGSLGGTIRAVAVQGQLAYVGEGSRMVILDVSDPAAPLRIAQTPPVVNAADVQVVGDSAYVAGDFSGFRIFDVSDPANPVQSGYIPYPGFQLNNLDVVGTRAYLAAGCAGGLRVVNVADPQHPADLGSFAVGDCADDVVVEGNYAYVAGQSAGLYIVNISDPSNLELVSHLTTGWAAYRLALLHAGGRTYVYIAEDVLEVVDVTDPANPTITYRSSFAVKSIASDGSYAYAGDYLDTYILDVSNPALPTVIGTYGHGATCIAITPQRIYLAGFPGDMQIVDRTDPVNLVLKASYRNLLYTLGVSVDDGLAYIADNAFNLKIADISDPTDPTLIGGFNPPSYWDYYAINEVAVSGNYAYSPGVFKFRVYDVTDPRSTVLLSENPLTGYAYHLAVAGNVLVRFDEAGPNSSLRVFDLSVPGSPVEVGVLPLPDTSVREVAMHDDLAYVATTTGLLIIDVSDPAQPQILSSYSSPGEIRDLSVNHPYAYLSDTADGLLVLDVTDPTAPSLVGSLGGFGAPQSMTSSANFVYLADDATVYAVDVSNPQEPALITSKAMPWGLQDIAADGEWVYVANYWDGLLVLHLKDVVNPPVAHPYFTAYPYDNSLDGYEWTEDSTISIRIDRPSTPVNPDFSTTQQATGAPNGGYFELGGGYDFGPGDTITVSDGTTTKTLVVSNVRVLSADDTNDRLTGTAGPNRTIVVRISGIPPQQTTSDAYGNWEMNLSGIVDLQAGTRGSVQELDEDGERTETSWHVLSPYIEADPGGDWIYAEDWPLGTLMTLTIHDPSGMVPDYTAQATSASPPWNPGNPNRNLAIFDLTNLFDLQAGYLITLEGGGTTRTYTPTQLQVTAMDLDAATISGIAAPGSQILVGFYSKDDVRHVIADASGNWTADFHHLGTRPDEQTNTDLAPGDAGDAVEYDANGNETYADWWVHSPYLIAHLTENLVDASEWPVGHTLTLTVDDPATLQAIDYSDSMVAAADPADPVSGQATFELSNFILRPGDVVSMADGHSTQILTVAEVAVTGIDLEHDVLSGTAGAGVSQVSARLWLPTGGITVRFVDVVNGLWSADFSVPGPRPQDIAWDIKPGDAGRARVDDASGNATTNYWEAGANTAPSAVSVVTPLDPQQIGTNVQGSAAFTDPDIGDTHTAVWDWGDGTNSTLPVSGLTSTAAHRYSAAGVYTVRVTITDQAGASAVGTSQFLVIYDPNGGFVTGGGWINSPAGAYTADPSLTGKATFSFESKYKKGATLPSGNTEFQFKVANFSFKSAAYDWLVIAGARAQYKGTGTINGSGSFGFLLTATDGQLNGGGGVDKFRIKIWDRATGAVAYDNMLRAADDATPTTVLGGGSIVIHK